jgi:hypothetical protein
MTAHLSLEGCRTGCADEAANGIAARDLGAVVRPSSGSCQTRTLERVMSLAAPAKAAITKSGGRGHDDVTWPYRELAGPADPPISMACNAALSFVPLSQ